ncbi:MAG TPA: hypothetical protein VGH79_07965 [Gaiellaceae bacterium]|jgi:hypothetical protein
MSRLLSFACRAFPRDYRARRSGELVDTALLVANGSRLRAAREALSLVVAGTRERVDRESRRPLRDGLWLLAVILAAVNLAVALVGAAAERAIPLFATTPFTPYPYRPGWWWIAFAVAAAGIVLGLLIGRRWIALGSALANFGLLAYAATSPFHVRGSQLLVRLFFATSYPLGSQWLAPAAVLALATAAAPLRRPALARLPLVVGIVAALVLLAHATKPWGDFLFLSWPLVVLVLLTIAFGSFLPRLTVLTVGLVLAAAPSGVTLFAGRSGDRAVTWFVTVFCILGAFGTFARLARRRLT